MNIAAISIVQHGDLFVTIECNRGRGIIFPGGKWKPGESFAETASRELSEETGLVAVKQELIYSGMSEDGFRTTPMGFSYVHAYWTSVERIMHAGWDGPEGQVQLRPWSDLLQSVYRPYYLLLEPHLFPEYAE